MEITIGQIIFRLILAAIFSGLLGLEREFKHKPAGLRTNILVGLGSTLIMLVSQQFTADPTRIAAGVITGIGFLCAGLVIQSRGEVHGITTATTIWLVAAIGLAIGSGYYFAAFVTLVIALTVLYLFGSEKIRKIANLEYSEMDHDHNQD
jgi:putative Mg2+ transporter-C (MgtC) family protein